MEHYGIRGKSLDWFSSYLINRSQFVSIHNIHSDVKNISGIADNVYSPIKGESVMWMKAPCQLILLSSISQQCKNKKTSTAPGHSLVH